MSKTGLILLTWGGGLYFTHHPSPYRSRHERLLHTVLQGIAALLESGVQTVVAPVVTALLYLLIFSHVLEAHVEVYPGVSYSAFWCPGW